MKAIAYVLIAVLGLYFAALLGCGDSPCDTYFPVTYEYPEGVAEISSCETTNGNECCYYDSPEFEFVLCANGCYATLEEVNINN